jgi:hypothetical protein
MYSLPADISSANFFVLSALSFHPNHSGTTPSEHAQETDSYQIAFRFDAWASRKNSFAVGVRFAAPLPFLCNIGVLEFGP